MTRRHAEINNGHSAFISCGIIPLCNFPYRNCVRSITLIPFEIIIPPAYEVCRGVYSYCLSVHLTVLPWFRQSVHLSSVNILRQSFAWSFMLFPIFLKAYSLGCLHMITVTSIWLQNSWQHSATAADSRSRSCVHTSVNILHQSFAGSFLLFLIFIPPAYEVCGGVYSFRHSLCLSVLPWFCPCMRLSIQVLTIYIKVLREVFCSFLYFWKLTL